MRIGTSWLENQGHYAHLEAEKLTFTDDVGVIDRLRKTDVLEPLLTLLYCFFVQGLATGQLQKYGLIPMRNGI